MGCNPQLLLDLSALRLNLQRARDAAPNSRIMAVIKADGYGHGMLRTAKALSEADALAVGRVLEVFGQSINAPMATDIAIYSHDIPFEWPAEVSVVVVVAVQGAARAGRQRGEAG